MNMFTISKLLLSAVLLGMCQAGAAQEVAESPAQTEAKMESLSKNDCPGLENIRQVVIRYNGSEQTETQALEAYMSNSDPNMNNALGCVANLNIHIEMINSNPSYVDRVKAKLSALLELVSSAATKAPLRIESGPSTNIGIRG